MKDLLTHRRGLALLAAVFLAFVAVQVARLWVSVPWSHEVCWPPNASG